MNDSFKVDSDSETLSVMDAMRSRYACKLFDPSRPVPGVVRDLILEAGRLSPSSFGLEHWHFFISEGNETKTALHRACFLQENIRTASFVVTIAVRTERHYEPESAFISRRAERFPGGLPAFIEEYRGHWDFLRSTGSVEDWAIAQGYIACANMMTAAAAAGVDSCAIEGFREDEVRTVLALDPSDWRISLLVPFGYRNEPVREKIREDISALVAFREYRA